MTELKTLKDFKIGLYIADNGAVMASAMKEGLKQEAIKWVKEMKDMPFIQFPSPITKLPDGSGCFTSDMINKEGIEDIIYWIKYFFNIIEEDLMTNEEINAREHGEVGNN